MFVNINERELKDFRVIELVRMNQDTDYLRFIDDYDTPTDVFGRIIAVKDNNTGYYYEVVTGIKIPVIEHVYDPSKDYYPRTIIPSSSYRGNICKEVYLSKNLINCYAKMNNNKVFKDSLYVFIEKAKKEKFNNRVNAIRKLIRGNK